MANETYLTWAEYQAYGGSAVTEAAFPTAEFKARKRIDYLTDCRVQDMATVPDAVKLCMTSIINAGASAGADAIASSPIVASFKTDGYSESYGTADEQQTAINKALNEEIKSMLYGVLDDNGTPLLYRGLDR